MNIGMLDKIVEAVLYEGYLLYPYRASAVKNRHRFNFGVLYPEAYAKASGDASTMQTECLILGNTQAQLEVRIRFLHLLSRETTLADGQQFKTQESRIDTWQEATEREVTCASGVRVGDICKEAVKHSFVFPSFRQVEPSNAESTPSQTIVRSQQELLGAVDVSANQLNDHLFRITAQITNQTPFEAGRESRDELLMSCFVSTHTILGIKGGEFVSLLDTPDSARVFATECHNIGTYPVLVGEEGQRDLMLSSPIILYDYPKVAPESAGNLFDGTEIDEILTLRILTLTDEEKREVRLTDERARTILDRTESLSSEQLAKLHGAARSFRVSTDDQQ